MGGGGAGRREFEDMSFGEGLAANSDGVVRVGLRIE